MATIDRLRDFHSFLKEKGFGGRNVFEREIGVSEGYLSQVKRKGVNSDVLEKVSEKFPDLNLDWLVTGRGSMFIQGQESDSGIDEDLILKLQDELREAYMEIGRLNMELKSAKEHELKAKRG